MVKTKPSWSPEVNESKVLTDKNKGHATNIRSYRGKKRENKTQGTELKAKTDYKGWCSDLEG